MTTALFPSPLSLASWVVETTLLCALLQQLPELKAAILVNEFGDVSVDGQIIRAEDGELNGM